MLIIPVGAEITGYHTTPTPNGLRVTIRLAHPEVADGAIMAPEVAAVAVLPGQTLTQVVATHAEALRYFNAVYRATRG